MPTAVESRTVQPIARIDAALRPPGSKSLTNRALLLAAMARGRSALHRPLWADDTRLMWRALTDLGVGCSVSDGGGHVLIQGQNGFGLCDAATLELGNAGTAVRMLTAACCLGIGRYRIDGDRRMRQRPIAELVDALGRLGARVEYVLDPGCPPLIITGTGLSGGELTLRPTLSSQYVSALLMVGPFCRSPLTLRFEGPLTSRPYVRMTIDTMRRFGAEVEHDPELTRATVRPTGYRAADFEVEPDASSAGYFLAAAALLPGSRLTVEGLGRSSAQGDAAFADVLARMGADVRVAHSSITLAAPPDATLRGIDIDLNDMPDLAQTLAVLALFAHGPTVIRNIGNLRVKETDRLAALRTELSKFGARVRIDGDDLHIHPPDPQRLAAPPEGVDTYHDHRMAMSFAVAGLRLPGVTIHDPACVAKSFPDFFDYLDRLGSSRTPIDAGNRA